MLCITEIMGKCDGYLRNALKWRKMVQGNVPEGCPRVGWEVCGAMSGRFGFLVLNKGPALQHSRRASIFRSVHQTRTEP